MTKILFRFLTISSLIFILAVSNTYSQDENILLIIADDLGVDISHGYHQASRMPNTPTLDSLRSIGITYKNVFAAPKCSPSRAAIMSGKYGIKTGVIGTPGILGTEHITLFDAVEDASSQKYADALIGKWHLSNTTNLDVPTEYGADYFMGFHGAGVSDYYNWDKVEDGISTKENQYVTSVLTEAAIDWISDQNQPWFLWFAHAAPHSPYHVPPENMYTVGNTNNTVGKYIASIEALDFSINQLLSTIPKEEREKTLVIYVGDNGTPNNVLQDYPSGRGKSTLYQGGVRVPMIIAGAGITRKGERESSLVHLADLYATIIDIVSEKKGGGIYNSLSFKHTFTGEVGAGRPFNHTEIGKENVNGWSIRNEQYKLIHFDSGMQEMYDLQTDSLETTNLLTGNWSNEIEEIRKNLENEGLIQRSGWSCIDLIKNGDEEGVDCGGSFCDPCITSVEEEDNRLELKLYPNPLEHVVTIHSSKDKIESISVLDAMGRFLTSLSVDSHTYQIDCTEYPRGLLYMEVVTKNERKTVPFQTK